MPDGDKILRIVSSPDQSMVTVTSSRYGKIAFFRFNEEKGNQMILSTSSTPPTPKQQITAYEAGTIKNKGVLALTFSPNNKILAVAWLQPAVLEKSFYSIQRMDPFIVRWMSLLLLSFLCLFQVTANELQSVELEDGEYSMLRSCHNPLSILSRNTMPALMMFNNMDVSTGDYHFVQEMTSC